MNTYPSNEELQQIANSSRPVTIDDIHTLAAYSNSIVEQVSGTVNNVACKMAEIRHTAAQVELQCAQLEHAFDCLMLKAQRDMKIYEQSLPILEKQFNFCQSRLDKLMDRAVDLICADVSDASLTRQETMMSLIEMANNSLNNLIAKLIPSY